MLRLTVFCFVFFCAFPALGADLQRFDGVRLVPTDWADGDSFRSLFPDGREHTLRLYAADCLEWHVSDHTDADRLREQRLYFGISGHGGSPQASIRLAKSLGEAAAVEVRKLLARPFTVYTSFADGRGDDRFKRIYAFVTTADGEDLAAVLVERGLARAFGVYRGTPEGLNRDDYRQALKDREFKAAVRAQGAWAYTDWDAFEAERAAERADDREAKIAIQGGLPRGVMDLNSAARDQLMAIPGIGEYLANAIIEERPYAEVDELIRVRGIGEKRLLELREWVRVGR